MDWFERCIGFAADRGDGSLEMLVFLALAILAAAVFPAPRRRLRGSLSR